MFDMEIVKNTFAVFGIVCFSTMAILSIVRMYDLVKLYGLKEGLKRWINGK